MRSRAPVPELVQRLLNPLRRDPAAATRALAAEPLERQVELVCEAPLAWRPRLLELLPDPGKVIPRLPEAELCFVAKAVGLADAGWILERATESQIVACLDLDAWDAMRPNERALEAWFQALDDAGTETFVRTARAIDPELLVLMLASRLRVWLKPSGDEEWEPPPGAKTLEGQFYFAARSERDDLADAERLLRALFEADYWLYFRMLQGCIWELRAETEEWALRWRTGRLQDLGFPSWDEAMRIYGYIRPDRLAAIPGDETDFGVDEWRLPVWLPRLPAGVDERHSLFRAIGTLDEEERRAAFFAFVALANRVAVADRMPLGDAESTPAAIEKAARVASRGLDHVVRENRLEPVLVLRRVSLVRLFRVGSSLDPASRPPVASDHADSEA